MTAQPDPYVRVYYRIIGDERFANVYDDDAALALWLRLLLAADAIYPAPASFPRRIRAVPLKKLVDAGLIEVLNGDRYVVHGLNGERGRRQDQARRAANTRWDKHGSGPASDAGASHAPMLAHSVSNAGASDNGMHSEPSRAEPRSSEPSGRAREGPKIPDLDPEHDALDAYVMVAGSPPSRGALDWLNRLAERWGEERIAGLIVTTYRSDPNLRSLLSRVETVVLSGARKAEKESRAKVVQRGIEAENRVKVSPEAAAKAAEYQRQIREWERNAFETKQSKRREQTDAAGAH